jgi:uncharacterized protein Usg
MTSIGNNNGNGKSGLKNAVIAALLAGFMMFWGGYALSTARDKSTIEDHEARLRLLEKTNYEMAADVRAIRKQVEAFDAKR